MSSDSPRPGPAGHHPAKLARTPIHRAASFDVIVIGAGMSGSIVAARCGEAGLSVLVIETGSGPKGAPRRKGVLGKLLADYDDGAGERWPTAVLVRRDERSGYREAKAVLGTGPGGSGRVYGAALGRGARSDFERDFQPAQWGNADHGEAALPNAWPVAYDEFLQAYRAAERLLGPVGTRDPLDPEDDASLAEPPPLSPAHRALVEQLERNGRHPFRMHVGIAYRPGCSECQGSTCPRDCKAHGFNRALQPVLERQEARVSLETQVTVRSLARAPDGSWVVHCTDAQGEQREIRAASVVLAAGALNSPRLLAASPALWDGEVPDLIGRGLMFHAAEMFAVAPPAGLAFHGPRKVIAFRDHYMDQAMPLAECQSLGMVASPALIAAFLYRAAQQAGVGMGAFGKLALRPAGEIGFRLFEGYEMFTAAIQDLPYRDNRVTTERDAQGRERIAVTYRPRREFIARVKRFRALMRDAFQPLAVRFPTAAGQPNFGHPMGTCRMGGAPDHSVVDPHGQVWNQPGLFVADASVFPSSLGINPALTVAAHAIRLADRMIAQTRDTAQDQRSSSLPAR